MSKAAELVFIPAPVVGHLISAVQVAKLILQTKECISISIHIINFPFQSDKINAYVDSQSRDNPYPTRLTFVRLPALSNLPDPNSPNYFATVIELHKPLVKQEAEKRVMAGLTTYVGFVLDMFCTTMADIASDLNVPSYIFFVSGAILLSFMFYVGSLADNHGLEAGDIIKKLTDPGFSSPVDGFKKPLTSKAIPAMFEEDEFGCEQMIDFTSKVRKMKGILVNSFSELETFSLQSLLNNDDKKIPQVYPVGPVLELDNKGQGWSDNKEKDSMMKWLDDQPESSVVFLCFGSIGIFSKEQVHEIANGLLRSGHRFLWALRKTSGESQSFSEALPEGFLEQTMHKGKVVGWAPQLEILAHNAVGGFVSHCGWNSVLESLWFGVPIAAWPMYADNQLHAFELVNELELAAEIRMDYKMDWGTGIGNFLVTATEIENGVNKLMSKNEKTRDLVKKVSHKCRQALQDGGSSHYWLHCFIFFFFFFFF
ncbi:anthocyanidin 3-O-glucosyltransferase 6-like [Silene latifolia]|uniref:anthocyanidin 3-O-glucosyltransferase 6-like n=1 Tax=Silene latifolia TaxID=37657 RepID=UPI003D77DB35